LLPFATSSCRKPAILCASGRAGTAKATAKPIASATAEAANAIVNPLSVDSPLAATVALTIPAVTWLPIAPPIVRTIVFIPVATPVWFPGTASTIRFASDAKCCR
jgi:hypothetical protein